MSNSGATFVFVPVLHSSRADAVKNIYDEVIERWKKVKDSHEKDTDNQPKKVLKNMNEDLGYHIDDITTQHEYSVRQPMKTLPVLTAGNVFLAHGRASGRFVRPSSAINRASHVRLSSAINRAYDSDVVVTYPGAS